MPHMEKYVVLEKRVGETPLQCVEAYKAEKKLERVPMAYAGRLDPMASGKLLVLLGDECKVQEKYHHLDKEYTFEVIFGVSSDTADVLGLITRGGQSVIESGAINVVIKDLIGNIELPYPHFSSKTVQGKPLHTWKLEGRIGEIEIPTKRSTIYKLKLNSIKSQTAQEVYAHASQKIETIPKVTDERKILGNDFRRVDVRATWLKFLEESQKNETFTIASFTCIASSGTYMRTLSEVIASKLNTHGLAFSIHRTKMGTYEKLPLGFGIWTKKF